MLKTVTLAVLVAAGAIGAASLTASPAAAQRYDAARHHGGSKVEVIYHRDRYRHRAHAAPSARRLARDRRHGRIACFMRRPHPSARHWRRHHDARKHRFGRGYRRYGGVHMVRYRVDRHELQRLLARGGCVTVHCYGARAI